MKSSGGFGAVLFTVAIGMAAGGGAFFWLRQTDQDKIRRLEADCQRMETRCNRAYEELDRVSQGNNSAVPSNLVQRADLETLQQSNATLQTQLNAITVSNATLKSELSDFAISNATLDAKCRSIMASNDLLKASRSSIPQGDPALQAKYDDAIKSNAVLKSEFEIVLQLNEILRTEQEGLKTNSISRVVYDDVMKSNSILQARYEESCNSNVALRAECDSLLKAKAAIPTTADNDALHNEMDVLMMSNAVLVVACEKAVQQNIELEARFNHLKDTSVDQAAYDAAMQSNVVLRTERAELVDATANLRTQVDSALQSNAVLAATCETVTRKHAELENRYNQLKKTTVDRAAYDDALRSNHALMSEQTKLRAANTELRAQVDSTLQSNAVLVVACKKAIQQAIEIENKHNQPREAPIEQAAYDAAMQSNAVLRTERTELVDAAASLRAQIDSTLQSNAVLVAEFKKLKLDSVSREVHSDVLWSNAVLRTANEALKASSVPHTAYASTVQSNAVLKAELASLTKRHVIQAKRYVKLGDRFVLLKQTHEKAEALLKAYRTRFLRQQEQSQKTQRKTTR